jgi:hypothetical protein
MYPIDLDNSMSEVNKALVRRVLEQVFNQRHVALIDELYPDGVAPIDRRSQRRCRRRYRRSGDA